MKILAGLILLLSFSAVAQDCLFCPTPSLNPFLPIVNLPELPKLVPIQKVALKKNLNASFCTRPVDMIDTIVIHHSDTGPSSTANEMNNFHVNQTSYRTNAAGQFIRDSQGRKIPDPWYMLGYSFVVNSAYEGQSLPKTTVTEGRPLEIVGSHAGSGAFTQMDEDQKKMWADGEVKCGVTGGTFKVDANQSAGGKIKANISSIGVVVAGNYAIKSSKNPGGYPPSKPRNPTAQTLDVLARLACQLQKDHPRIKTISWHASFSNTLCPGNLQKYGAQLKQLTKGYGCEFN